MKRSIVRLAEEGRKRVSVISLQVVLPNPKPVITAESLLTGLQGFHSSLGNATVKEGESTGEGLIAVARWTDLSSTSSTNSQSFDHRVDVIVRNECPLPPPVVEQCVRYALYPESVKQKVAEAQSTIYLAYRDETSARVPLLEQYIATSAVAGALAEEAVGVLNLNARTSVPASLFRRSFIDANFGPGRTLDFFRGLPLTTIYCGFARYTPESAPDKFGFRTHGAELLGLPNLAAFSASPEASDAVFYVFHTVWDFMLQRGKAFEIGETVQLTSDAATAMRVRAPLEQEKYLHHPPGSVIVLEPINGWESLKNFMAPPAAAESGGDAGGNSPAS